MWSYTVKRLLLVIPTLIGIQTIMFFVSEFVPGGPLHQLYAKLQGKDHFGAGTMEVSSTSYDKGKEKKVIDPKEELRLKRELGLNLDRFERYMRTLLWFSKDSFISSGEIDQGSAQKVSIGEKKVIVFRTKEDEYLTFVNSFETDVTKTTPSPESGKPESVTVKEAGEIVYDAEANAWRSVLDNSILFDLHTGAEKNGNRQLQKITCVQNLEKFTDYRINQDGTREAVPVTRTEVYVKEGLWESLTNWDNWHGFFLLKFPRSESYNKKSLELIWDRLPISASLGVSSFFLTYLGCLTLGILKSVRNGTRFDLVTSFLVLIGYSIPGFVLAIFLLKLFGPGPESYFNIIPLSGMHSDPEVFDKLSWFGKILDYLHHMIAPVICLTISSFAAMTFLTKNSIMEQFNQLYATAARARGLSERKVLFKHVLRNSLIPLVTGFPASFVMMLLGSSLLIEQIFTLEGLGLLSYTAVLNRDFPLIMSNLFIFTLIGLFCRLLTDICYVVVDPRISFDESKV